MLQIKHYTKQYSAGGPKAVDDLSLHIRPGEIYGFLGHNGAGKTTTIKACCGILDFTEGEILINGMSIRKQPMECKKIMAYIPDNPDLYEFMSGIQYLNFIGDVYRVPADVRQQRIAEFGDDMGITKDLADKISSYSHGMKQKLAIVAALIHDPKLLIMDEPFVGLDPKAAYILKQIMRKVCDRGGAIFFSTHVLDVAEKLCDKIAIIRSGVLLADGDIDTVKGNESLEEVFLELVDDMKVEEE
ncbi:MAG: ABC transporter ATP-binding protein [Lachnospiraceae bacterium]|nr:ABC transporter ATP-binding protein [Lachnospiraceae bacterium]